MSPYGVSTADDVALENRQISALLRLAA